MSQEEIPESKYREIIDSFCLMDDEFMTKCFEDNIECTELVLHIILGNDDLEVQSVHAQHSMKNLQGRSIRLDVYATDRSGKKYNIEIQRSDKGADARRARYNSSLIDANTLESGEDFDNLSETYVIFITENDVLGGGKPIYHIERKIEEFGNKIFGDGSHIIYVNAQCRDNTPLGLLMQDFSCTSPNRMNYGILAERTRYFKEDKEGFSTMSRIMEEFLKKETAKAAANAAAKAAAEAAEKAKWESNRATALRMLKIGKLSYEEIAEYSGLSLDEVKALADKTPA